MPAGKDMPKINIPAAKKAPATTLPEPKTAPAKKTPPPMLPVAAETKQTKADQPLAVTPNGVLVKMVQWFDDHFYKVVIETEAGEVTHYFPSVTTVLGIIIPKFLVRWRGEVGNEEADRRLNEGSRRGSIIHHACEVIEQGGAVVFNDFRKPSYTRKELVDIEAVNPIMMVVEDQFTFLQIIRYKRWLKAVQPKPVAMESMVYDVELESAGTLDRVYYIAEGDYLISGKNPIHLREGLYVVDIKSSSAIDEKYFHQIATYAKMFSRMNSVEIVGGLIVHTNADLKTGIEGLKTYVRTPDQMEEDYQAYVDTYRVWKRNNPDKRPTVFDMPAILTMETEV